ncbi:MAG TPA: DUF4340 domain-containing protein [Bacteroidota bacterium]|nr:DUF4340 domain-containing protein [Bacteroidota bacterium]
MRSGTVVALVLAAAAAGVAAWVVTRGEHASGTAADARPATLFPQLKDHVNDVASITVKRGADEFTIQRTAAAWDLKEKSGYPVRYEAVKGIVVGLSDVRLVEPKTTRPESYSKIGVQDPDGKAPAVPETAPDPDTPIPTTPTLLTLMDDKGAVLASVIVGAQKWGQTPQVYLRKAGDAQSWLADGRIDVPSDAMGWLDRQFLNIPRERIKSAIVTHPDGVTLTVSRQSALDTTFTVQNIPAGRELSSPTSGDSLGNALSYLSMDDVKPAADAGFTDSGLAAGVETGPTAVFTFLDGTTISVHTAKKNGKTWARFAVTYQAQPVLAAPPDASKPEARPASDDRKPEDVQKEATDLNTRLAPWAFSIPDYKTKALFPKMDDLLKPLPTPAPAPAPETAPPQPAPSPTPPSTP